MQEAKFTQTDSMFSLVCRIEITIRTKAERIWGLLANANDFPRWNSTVTSIEGQIREGEKLRLRVPGTKQVFTPKVSGLVLNQRMTWTGGFFPMFLGVRNFELKPQDDGSTDFVMEERFSGLMLPLIKRSLPDFEPVFKRYAEDLKNEAEKTV